MDVKPVWNISSFQFWQALFTLEINLAVIFKWYNNNNNHVLESPLFSYARVSQWLKCYKMFADFSWYDQYNISRPPTAVIHSSDCFRAKPTKSMTCSSSVYLQMPRSVKMSLKHSFSGLKGPMYYSSRAPFCWQKQF